MGILVLVFLGGHPALAQRIAVGVEGGVRTMDDVSGSLTPESKRYIVGPMVELRLPLRLSFEFDALYRRFGFTGYQSLDDLANSITRERANSWEFPMILKYNLPGVLAHPFVGVGYAPRTVHGTDVSSGSYLYRPEHPHVLFQPTLGHDLLMDARPSGFGRRESGCRSRAVFARGTLYALECAVLERGWWRRELPVRLQAGRTLRSPRCVVALSLYVRSANACS
jgi:hypothetical protein